MALAIGIFILIFGLIAVVAFLGLKYQESERKKKLGKMLEAQNAARAYSETTVLLEADAKPSALTVFIEKFNFAQALEEKIQQAGLNWSVTSLVARIVLFGALGALAGAAWAPLSSRALSALVFAPVAGSLPYLYVARQRKKRLDAFEAQFPEALDFLSRAMRAGHAFTISMEMLADDAAPPLGFEIRKVFNEQNLGSPLDVALGSLAKRVPLLDVKFFVSAVLLQRETGGNLSEILSRLAHVIRERFKLKGQVRAASAHGRITGSILTVMPVALAFGLMVISPGYLQGMMNEPEGKWMVGGAILGMILGHFTIQKIVKIKV